MGAKRTQSTPPKPRHIALAVRNDDELNKLLATVTIASGGVLGCHRHRPRAIGPYFSKPGCHTAPSARVPPAERAPGDRRQEMSCAGFILAQPPVCTHTGGGVVGHLHVHAQPLFLCSAGGARACGKQSCMGPWGGQR